MVNKDPRHLYYDQEFPKQKQPEPGLQAKLDPVPDDGAKTYTGSGRLIGRKALITGADSGIGRAVAIAYAREGADVALNYLPAEEADAQEVKTIIEQTGHRAILIPGDLKEEAFNQQLVDQAVSELGGLDILALVAGKQQAVEDIIDLTTAQLVDTYATNVFSLFWTVKAALPHLSAGASIITTSSIQASQPSPFLLDYASTKAAIDNFTYGLAKQLGPKGIRVNTVAPGPVWTPLQVVGGQLEENIPKFGQSTPLGRAAQPAELAGAYVYLASDDASYVTGQNYGVNGGTR